MPLFPESSTTDAVWKRRSRKWTLPALWVILAVWFLKANYFSNHSSDSSSTSSSPNSPLKTSLLHNPLNPLGSTELPQAIAANVSTSSKVAVIIETRRSGNIVPLILHFSAVLGPTWPLVIYTSAENFGSFSTSAALLRHQRSGRIVVRSLSEGVWFKNWDSVSAFLTSHWLWEDLAPAENILLFQSDSVLCSNAVRSVDDFFDYDLIGAPIDPRWGVGYNGGLSLRKRATVLRVLDEWSWATKPVPYPEDQWFYARYVFFRPRGKVLPLLSIGN